MKALFIAWMAAVLVLVIGCVSSSPNPAAEKQVFAPLPADHPAGLVSFAEKVNAAMDPEKLDASRIPKNATFTYDCYAPRPWSELTNDEFVQAVKDHDTLERATNLRLSGQPGESNPLIEPLFLRGHPLARLLWADDFVYRSDSKAVALGAELVFRAAESGCFLGKLYAAYFYRHGIGVFPNEKEAERWAERAAASGFPFAVDYAAISQTVAD